MLTLHGDGGVGGVALGALMHSSGIPDVMYTVCSAFQRHPYGSVASPSPWTSPRSHPPKGPRSPRYPPQRIHGNGPSWTRPRHPKFPNLLLVTSSLLIHVHSQLPSRQWEDGANWMKLLKHTGVQPIGRTIVSKFRIQRQVIIQRNSAKILSIMQRCIATVPKKVGWQANVNLPNHNTKLGALGM